MSPFLSLVEKNGSNILGRFSLEIPTPVSDTSIFIYSSSKVVVTPITLLFPLFRSWP